MSDTKHTPGPWHASEGYPTSIWHVDAPSLELIVAHEDMDAETAQANARLIAAAPDLLAAAEGAIVLLDRLRAETWHLKAYALASAESDCSVGHYAEYHFGNLRAAIASAKGGE